MSRVSKAGRYTEEIEKINAQKIIDSQEKFGSTHWLRATGTNDRQLQLERIDTQTNISDILSSGYPSGTWIEPEPAPQPTPQPTIRTTKFGDSVSTIKPTTTIEQPPPQPTEPRLSTYFMKSPSGQCRQVSISEEGKRKLESTGHIFSRTNICIETVTTTKEVIDEPVKTVIDEPVIITLSAQTLQIIDDIESGRILVPQWFLQDISMVRNGTLSEQVFINMYNNLLETGEAHAPLNGIETTEISNITNAGMVLQSLDNFQISNGRLTGTINFKASDTFNPYYYNKDLVNYLQISTEAGKTFRIKENRLRFGISNNLDLVETIHYDESTDDLTKIKVESFVVTSDNFPMSGKLSLTVDEITGITEEAKSGFLGAGFTGAVAITILLGFLIGDRK